MKKFTRDQLLTITILNDRAGKLVLEVTLGKAVNISFKTLTSNSIWHRTDFLNIQ